MFITEGFNGKMAVELGKAEYEKSYTSIKPFYKVRAFLKTRKL
ncbi:MAG: hypothetical protein ACSLEY_01525 [Candidatus Saccharimonadales bacterium]